MRHTPDWIAGISIGAINAALIAGNRPEHRVARLREFWETVSSFPFGAPVYGAPTNESGGARHRQRDQRDDRDAVRRLRLLRAAGAGGAVPAARHAGGDQLLRHRAAAPRRSSSWSTSISSTPARCACSVGAVNVRSGNFVYFDSRHRRDRRAPHHGQRRPAAGLSADRDRRRVLLGRRPGLEHAAAVRARPAEPRGRGWCSRSTCSPPRGEMPANLAEASEREKDIRYSSRTRLTTTYELRRQATLQAARRLVAKLPPALRDDPDAQALAALPLEAAVAGRPPHLPQQALREPVEGLRVLARLDARALGRRHDRHPDHARGSALARRASATTRACTCST